MLSLIMKQKNFIKNFEKQIFSTEKKNQTVHFRNFVKKEIA